MIGIQIWIYLHPKILEYISICIFALFLYLWSFFRSDATLTKENYQTDRQEERLWLSNVSSWQTTRVYCWKCFNASSIKGMALKSCRKLLTMKNCLLRFKDSAQ